LVGVTNRNLGPICLRHQRNLHRPEAKHRQAI
jgi:hypothetical protein